MEPGLIWILGGLLLLLAELALPGIFLLWVGLAAIGTGVLMLVMVLDAVGITVTFIALLAAGIGLALQRRLGPPPTAEVNRPESGLVGRHGVLLPESMGGPRVRIGDSEWPARLAGELKVPDGGEVRVKVEGVQGTTLVVRPE